MQKDQSIHRQPPHKKGNTDEQDRKQPQPSIYSNSDYEEFLKLLVRDL